jgi:hypothetical protein
MHRLFKHSVFIPAAALAVSAAALAAPQAAYASSGGGCSNWAAVPGTANPTISTQSCIGGSGSTVWGWLYWNNTSSVYTCWGTLKVRDDTLGTFRAYNVNGCSPMEVVFTGIQGHHYHVYSNANAVTYGSVSNFVLQWEGTVPNSPELNL